MEGKVDEDDAQESETRSTIDLSNLAGKTQRAAASQAAYLVDMAKAEALDSMGETERAVALVDRHIRSANLRQAQRLRTSPVT